MLGGIAGLLAIILFVTAHEAGHFIAAKATGMKATEFFFGFGPKLWSFNRGETEYGVKLIPFGGYVRIVGMSPFEEVAPEDIGRTYREQVFWKKSVVVLAGVAMNFMLAYLIFWGLNVADGMPEPTREVGVVVEELADGTPTPAAMAGLEQGDLIVAIDGVSVSTWDEVSGTLAAHPNEDITVTVDRDGTEVMVQTTLAARSDGEGEERGFLGVGPVIATRSVGVFEGAGLAGRQVWGATAFAVDILGRLVRPDSIAQLAGGLVGQDVDDEIRPVSPIGIVQIGAQASTIGISNYIALLASVNIILGTLNVLPLYPLDGGHFAVAVYERVTGRRADFRKLAPIAAMVIAFVVFLGLVAIVLDIVNPINL